MIIKVCGMRNLENICQVAEIGIDWMGFILYDQSPRFIGSGQRERIVQSLLDYPVQRVGVFVNSTFELMMEAVKNDQLDCLQLHGDEPPGLCRELKKRGITLIKAIGVASATDLQGIEAYQGTVDYFLFDTRCDGYGGSGKLFDWSVLNAYRGNIPFLLSGGICPESIGALLAFSHPRWVGVDLNSGFESEPGFKDPEKLRLFIQQLKTKKQ